ncbi:MAG: IS3 family transposase [Treponema sp.]|nr:IS3 family transposase [Treponema sp.]
MRANRERYPIRELAGLFGVRSSAYYKGAKHGVSERRSKADAELTAFIGERHHRRYESPRVWETLRARYGKRVNRKKGTRLMREHGLNARRRRNYIPPTNSNHGLPVCEPIRDRQFDAGKPGCLISRSCGPPAPGYT